MRLLVMGHLKLTHHRGSGKCAGDDAEWLPPRSQCWFADRVVSVRRKYRLTIDPLEAAALDRVLSGCGSTVGHTPL